MALTNWKVQNQTGRRVEQVRALTKRQASQEREGNGVSKRHLPAGRQVRRGRELERASGTHQLESAESDREEGRASEGTHQQAGKSEEEGKWGEQGALASWKAGQVREGLE